MLVQQKMGEEEEGGVDIYNPVIINVAAFTEIFITFPRKRVAMKKVE